MFPRSPRDWARLAILTGLLLVFFACIALTNQSKPESSQTVTDSQLASQPEQATRAPRPTATTEPTATAEPTDTPVPSDTPVPTLQDPVERLLFNIQDVLGNSNRDVERISEYWYDPEQGLVCVMFAINDNLTSNLRRYGARADVLDILEQVALSGLDYSGVDVLGTFSLVDEYGNVSESVVVSLYYSRETVERINFENMLADNVYAIADNVAMIHSELRD